ncbi:tyrosine-type recombinase/integrase [Sulfitobacter sp. SK012]|uniref:tyrosine-type recombinase/integrase n=1 Tax=Sulfitobacter sp. SK012 TaxID=1389005 RepID=UPI0013B41F11|nr:integrase arm-type DNA-binding domain-containing protein [Sulfitobacter sp. SK012]
MIRKLTDSKVKTAKPGDKVKRVADGNGLTLTITPNGTKTWHLRYRRDDKATMVSLGRYPDVSLAIAREKADQMRAARATGVDPVREKERQRRQLAVAPGETFEEVAADFFAQNAPGWSDAHADRFRFRIEKDVNPAIGNMRVGDIRPTDVLSVVRSIEGRGAVNSGRRVKGMIGQVMRYAVALGLAPFDPSRDIGAALKPSPKAKHRAALIHPEEIAKFMRRLYAYNGTSIVRPALEVLVRTFQRPGEVRCMRWADIDLEDRIWRDGVTKVEGGHAVPLSRQVLRILEEQRGISGHREYVWSNPYKPFSDVMFSKFLRTNLTYDQSEVSAHGFRATARTVLAERLKYEPRIIELQLSHAVPETHGGAYNRALYMDQRSEMMQHYSDWLDQIAS